MLHRRLFVLPALVVAGVVLSLLNGSARAQDTPHRALRAALYHLKEAKEEVKDERFRRHREQVEKDLNVATREIERALREGKIAVKYEPAPDWGKKYKNFKHLRQALVELDLAKVEIGKEKGEWAKRRELREAIEDAHKHVKEALEEVK